MEKLILKRMKGYRFLLVVLCVAGMLFGCAVRVCAAGSSEKENTTVGMGEEAEGDITSILDEVDFSQVDQLLEEQDVALNFDFRGLVEKLISGEDIDKQWLFDTIRDVFFQEISQSRGYMILLVAAFALLYNFANVFENAAVTDISFYIVYMILLALLMKSFLLMSGILTGTLHTILGFLKALLPSFCLTMVFSTGSATAMGFYQLTLLMIFVVESVLTYLVVPAVHIYILLELLNHLTREEMISKMTELLKTVVEWSLKCLFTLVIGVNVVQGLLTPVIDGLKTSTFARTASMLPGVGNSFSAVTEIMVGSGIVIKNGVGVAGMLLVIALCAGPLVKVGILTLLYKLSAAVVQPIADKRLAGCISGMGEGAGLFGKILITADVMILLTIALITAATTWNR